MKVVWTDTAKGNLRTIHRYIAQNSPAYANRMIDKLTNRSKQIGAFPLSGRIAESQKFLVGEACRPDTNLTRKSFAEQIKDYAPNVRDVNDKDGILNLLRVTMDESKAKLIAAGDELRNTMKRFDGKEMTKLAFMSFAIAHEMYHRGQLTVYERLLGIEPALTQRFRKAFGESPP